MIAKLTGILAESDLTEILLDVNGVGYAVSIPLSTFEKLPLPGNKISLFTHLNVREDALQLFGFATKEERTLFQVLTGAVSGVGAKLALNVLSSLSIQGFMEAVASGDVKRLSKINGIGKKTAERIIVEMKDKLGGLFPTAAPGILPAASGNALQTGSPESADATAALETLGFKRDAAEKAVQAILAELPPDTHPSAEQLIRKALARLNN